MAPDQVKVFDLTGHKDRGRLHDPARVLSDIRPLQASMALQGALHGVHDSQPLLTSIAAAPASRMST